MNSRERMLAAIEFRQPDRIPVFYHASSAGLYVHGRKLLDLFRALPPDNQIEFTAVPRPSPEWIDAGGNYHEFRRDRWGTTWEYLIFGIQGHPKEYALTDWESAKQFVFPPIPEFRAVPEAYRREYLLFGGEGSLFECPSGLRPFDEVMMDFYTETPELLAFTDRLVEYFGRINEQALREGYDVFCFGDDFGTQQNAIFPAELFRKIFTPRYRKLFEPLKKAGKKIQFHSCGKIDSLLDCFAELGIDILWPQLSLYGRDEAFLERCARHRIALLLHPDRQYLIPRGTPEEIRDWVRFAAERYRDGGGIFYVEIENDAPWENVKTLLESIEEFR